MRTRRPLADRFWEKVAISGPNECWLWTASLNGNGYGKLWAMPDCPTNTNAHVVSWFLAYGSWPSAGLSVLHNCPTGDNKACVNPTHLWLGTQKDNVRDMVAKGRHYSHAQPERLARGIRNGAHTHPERVLRGEQVGTSKLTDIQWQEILLLWGSGNWTIKSLGIRYGVHPTAIGNRLRRAHIPAQKVGNSKITIEQWKEALTLWATGEWSKTQLAMRYSVTVQAISKRFHRAHISDLRPKINKK